jgi:hypothetical protein
VHFRGSCTALATMYMLDFVCCSGCHYEADDEDYPRDMMEYENGDNWFSVCCGGCEALRSRGLMAPLVPPK